MSETKRFKLIDKEGYLEIFMNNKNYLSKYFDSNLVSIPLTKDEDEDWCVGYSRVITREELQFFEEYVEEEPKQSFTKSDLVSGKHVVKLRGYDEPCLLLGSKFINHKDWVTDLVAYDEDMKHTLWHSNTDIMEVFTIRVLKNLSTDLRDADLISVWKREDEEMVKLKSEIDALKKELSEKEKQLEKLK